MFKTYFYAKQILKIIWLCFVNALAKIHKYYV